MKTPHVFIYQPAKTAMQSGLAKTKRWKLEFKPTSGQYVEPLMGWVGQKDTQQQLSLFFDSKEQAVAYAEERGLPYHVKEPHRKAMRPKSYSDNFRFDAVKKTS
jgi:ETC complex I subunit conserved region